jgi:hypothetical protein
MAKGIGGKCSCCTSPHRREIDLALVAGVGIDVIAKRFDVSRDSVWRHGKRHLSAVQRAALATALKPSAIDLEQLQRTEGESLLGQLLAQRATLQTYGAAAFEAKQYQAAISAERAVTDNLDLLSKVLGLIITKHEVRSTSLLISPDYLALRHALVEALKPYPDAMASVGRALHELEVKAAADIKAKANGRRGTAMKDPFLLRSDRHGGADGHRAGAAPLGRCDD